MRYQNPVLEAVNTVLVWDVPDEALADAVNDRVRMIDGHYPD